MSNSLFSKLEKAKSQRSVGGVVFIVIIILRAIPSKIIASILSPIASFLVAIGPTGFGILVGVINILPLLLIVDVIYLSFKIRRLKKELIRENICEKCGYSLSEEGLKCLNCNYSKEDEDKRRLF